MPINSVIGVPKQESRVEADGEGCIDVKGYALPSGADGPIVRVEVSGDGGESWVDAELLGAGDEVPAEEKGGEEVELKWAWCLWRASVKVEKGKERVILSRATDTGGNTQAKCPEWNFRGVAYNGYGEVGGLEVV